MVIAFGLGLLVLLFGGAFALIESGEVIVLRDLPEDGGGLIARLWVVDFEGDAWIGKADPSQARWVARLTAAPRVEFTRAGVSDCRSAEPARDPATRQAVYALFQSKYRIPLYGSRLIGTLFGSNPDPAEAERSGVLFRLDACPPRS